MSQIAEKPRTETNKGVGQKVSQLDQLKRLTKVVADTGDFATLKQFAPEDATTNPSLILKAAQKPEYKEVVEKAIADVRGTGLSGEALLGRTMTDLLVLFGVEILKVVPGRVSTETDASLAFDTPALMGQARLFIEQYRRNGVPRERVLVKLASTWEGVVAAEVLQKEGINCNMTLLFSIPQAAACAAVKAKLISPFVGRILDWYKKNTGKDYPPAEDPGVQSVKEIYAYYKNCGFDTEVMGASFRNKGEILQLAGCDALTISPSLLAELKASTDPVERMLSPEQVRGTQTERLDLDEKAFRWLLNENAMATDKLAEGIRLFNADALKLKAHLTKLL